MSAISTSHCGTHCGKMKNLLSPKNISSNQLFSNFISKTVVLTKFLPKKCESKIPFFPQCVEITEIYSH